MRIAGYNIFEGARDTYPLIIDFVLRHDIDVICLQEADDWHTYQEGERSRLKDFAERTGLTHYAFGDSNTMCKVITYSRLPIERTELYTKGFHHCAVKTTIQSPHGPVKVVNSHLTPYSARQRYHEARRIARIAGDDSVIVLDANNPHRHDNQGRSLERSLKGQGNTRFGAKQLCYGALDHLIHSGYADTAAHMGTHTNTYPTPIQTDPYHAHTMKLDYIFVPAALTDAIKDYEVVKDEITDLASDHYPDVVTLGPPTAATHAPFGMPSRDLAYALA